MHTGNDNYRFQIGGQNLQGVKMTVIQSCGSDKKRKNFFNNPEYFCFLFF
jgi:hypothetical protein